MRRIGRVIHITPSEKAVIKAENLPRIGEMVVDEKRNSVGTVFDVFGPTPSPYVEVKPDVEDPHKLVNGFLYVLPSYRRKGKGKKRKK